MTSVRLEITGMSCGHCVSAVRQALSAVPGAQVDDVSIGAATVTFDPTATTAERLAATVSGEGYPARVANA
jgi:copper chaperone